MVISSGHNIILIIRSETKWYEGSLDWEGTDLEGWTNRFMNVSMNKYSYGWNG